MIHRWLLKKLKVEEVNSEKYENHTIVLNQRYKNNLS